MIGSSRIDDKIIYSWCFNFVEYFDSTSFATIDVLVKTVESLSNFRSQHVDLSLSLTSLSSSLKGETRPNHGRLSPLKGRFKDLKTCLYILFLFHYYFSLELDPFPFKIENWCFKVYKHVIVICTHFFIRNTSG